MKTSSETQEHYCECGHGLYNHGEAYPASETGCKVVKCDCQGFTLWVDPRAKTEQDEAIFQLCYDAIRHSGLYKQLDNDAWDALAERMTPLIRTRVEGLINAEFTRLESESQKVSEQ